MLTKNLLRYRVSNNKIIPKFIDTSSDELALFARELLSVYDNTGCKLTKADIDEQTLPIINRLKDQKLSKGLNKIIQDYSEFDSTDNLDNLPEKRAELFSYTTKLIQSLASESKYTDYKDDISSQFPFIKSNNISPVYGDLPELDTFSGLRMNFSPQSLLSRYNCSLVQSLLIYSGELKLYLLDPEPSQLRGIIRFIKFFRLVALIQKNSKKENQIDITIDGPASIFGQIQKYGLQLASFFPVICFLKNWKLESQIHIKNRNYKLVLSNENGLVSHYRNPASYIPEEFKMFANLFKEKNKEWELIESGYFLDTGNQQFIFPDFTFKNSCGKKVYIELFHRWHSSLLKERIKFCSTGDKPNYILGIDRFLYKTEEIKNELNNSLSEGKEYFLFNDFPGVHTISKILQKI